MASNGIIDIYIAPIQKKELEAAFSYIIKIIAPPEKTIIHHELQPHLNSFTNHKCYDWAMAGPHPQGPLLFGQRSG